MEIRMVHANASKPRMVHRQCSFASFPSSTDLRDVKAINEGRCQHFLLPSMESRYSVFRWKIVSPSRLTRWSFHIIRNNFVLHYHYSACIFSIRHFLVIIRMIVKRTLFRNRLFLVEFVYSWLLKRASNCKKKKKREENWVFVLKKKFHLTPLSPKQCRNSVPAEISKSSSFNSPRGERSLITHNDGSVIRTRPSLCRGRRPRRAACPFFAVVAANRLLHPSRGSHYGRGLKKGPSFSPSASFIWLVKVGR